MDQVEDAHPQAGSASGTGVADAARGPGGEARVVPVLRPAAMALVTPLPRALWRKRVAQPLGRGVAALLGGSALLAVAAASLIGLALAHGEWAAGLRAEALAALALGTTALVATVARAAAGRRSVRAVALGLGAALLLGLCGDAGLTLIPATHLAQARADESSGQFEQALMEYSLADAHAPSSRDLARVHIAWGDALARDGRYVDAVEQYATVLRRFPGVSAQIAPARRGLLSAYGRWILVGGGDLTYDDALGQLTAIRQAPWCDMPCQSAVDALLAQGHYAAGRAAAHAGQHADAAAHFDSVTARFPASPYAPLAHAAAAVEYLAIGQAQRTGTTCTDAVPTYQKLATTFADTPEGATAKQALAAPVDVTGSLVGYPTDPAPTMYLSRRIVESTTFSDEYGAALNPIGAFTFSGVLPGSYNLSAAFPDGSGIHWYDAQTGNPYNIVVGPLCTLALPEYSWV
jgi:tetratricopeptide (TPR) repeat protein